MKIVSRALICVLWSDSSPDGEVVVRSNGGFVEDSERQIGYDGDSLGLTRHAGRNPDIKDAIPTYRT
ncbi:MAG: hypothetical protein SPD11_05010 [Sphaerochaetaceae bacterium]|nr:hypothetical protein [Sphaerochaetaceae bacterium]